MKETIGKEMLRLENLKVEVKDEVILENINLSLMKEFMYFLA